MSKLRTPTNEEIRAVRRAAKISQSKAATLVHLGCATRWSEYERGTRRIDLARWELFLMKTGMHPASKAPTKECT